MTRWSLLPPPRKPPNYSDGFPRASFPGVSLEFSRGILELRLASSRSSCHGHETSADDHQAHWLLLLGPHARLDRIPCPGGKDMTVPGWPFLPSLQGVRAEILARLSRRLCSYHLSCLPPKRVCSVSGSTGAPFSRRRDSPLRTAHGSHGSRSIHGGSHNKNRKCPLGAQETSGQAEEDPTSQWTGLGNYDI
jgi:hypothetical protein